MNARTAVARKRIGVAPVLAAALAAALLLGGCLAEQKNVDESPAGGGGGGGGGGTAITWADLTGTGGAIKTNCGCHASADQPILTTNQYSTIIAGTGATNNIAYVVKNSRSSSLLYLVTQANSGLTTPSGATLPMPGGSSAAADIGDWIDGGALEK